MNLSKDWNSVLILLALSCSSGFVSGDQLKISEHPVVIVISVDGFRYDFLSKADTPNIDKLVSEGVTAPYMKAQFMTKTLPNHQSIATGLYTESHGIVDNKYYIDPVSNLTFDAYTPEFWNYDPDVVPVWTRNEWAGRTSGTVLWPGSNYPYGLNKTLPTYFQGWNASWAFEDRVDLMIDMITNPKSPANIVFLYVEEPDFDVKTDLIGHVFGPESPEMEEQIRILDNRVGSLTSRLKKLNLLDSVNLILLGDHGLVEIQQTRIINITQLVDKNLYRRSGGSPVYHIYPRNDQNLDFVYETFKAASVGQHFSVYKKEDIPERWHFRNGRRVGPIVLVSDVGYVFNDYRRTIDYYNARFNLTASPNRVYGHHGFDNESDSMRAFFVARGPAFKKGTVIEPFENVDIVPLISHITGLPPFPTNGSVLPFQNALVKS